MTDDQAHQVNEVARCMLDRGYFVTRYVMIEDATLRRWVPFRLYALQRQALTAMQSHRLLVMLKARQLGLTWLVLAYVLGEMLFNPAPSTLLFSRRDDEAMALLDRLKGMFVRLPPFLRAGIGATVTNEHEWLWSSGSSARAFPTTGGDAYTASIAVVDEAGLVENFARLMASVEPTISGGGQMIVLGRANKGAPLHEFHQLYRSAVRGEGGWYPVFLPWWTRETRDAAWYEAQRASILARTGSLDDLYEQFPATDTEALRPRERDKRLPGAWIEACYRPAVGLDSADIAGLRVFASPVAGRRYVVGCDPAEGNPTSDPTAIQVVDEMTGEQMAESAGPLEPAMCGERLRQVSVWYNRAGIMVERNNHGHAVLLWLREHGLAARILAGLDGKPGWLSNSVGKAAMYTTMAEALRYMDAIVHCHELYHELASIDGATLRAPAGMMDDRAVAYCLAMSGRGMRPVGAVLAQGRAHRK